MKIAYCTWSILGTGGLDRVLAIKANYLADVLGHDVTIITTFNGKGSPFYHFSPKIRLVDLGVEYRGDSFFSKLSNRIKQRKILKIKLAEALDELKPDITISLFQNEASLLPSMKDGSIKIIENHSTRYYVLLRSKTPIDKLISRIKYYNQTMTVRRYDALITLTEEDKNDWPSDNNIHVIPNPLTIKCEGRASFKGKRVLAVGRITYDKGFHNLVKAWNIVERKHPDWELVIIGAQYDNEYVDYIKNLIQYLNVKHVTLREPTKAIEEEYMQSNILVLTSNYEGFGLVLTEGMSVGLPLVSFDCKCGPSDIIKDGENGFLVKGKDIEVFADRVCRLIEDKKLHDHMSTKALEYSKLYDVENIMSKWISLFEQLIENQRKKIPVSKRMILSKKH